MAISCSSQARIVSSSRREPPGWMIAVTPAAAASVRAVAEREERVGGEHGAPWPAGRPSRRRSAPSRAGSSARRPRRRSGRPRASTIALDLTAAQTRQAKARSRRSSSVGERRVGTLPAAGSASMLIPVLDEQPPFDPPEVDAQGRWSRRGRSARPRSSRRTLFRQVGLVVSHSRASSLEAGGEDRLQESAGDWHIRSAVARSTGRFSADDPAEGADRIALVGPLESRGRVVGDRGAAGVVVLEDAGRGLGEQPDQPQGTVEVQQVVVGQLLAVTDRWRSRGSARARPARRRTRPAGGGSRRNATDERSTKRQLQGRRERRGARRFAGRDEVPAR